MLIINSVDDVQAVLDRALHITASRRLPWRKSLAAAIHEISQEQGKSAMDARKAELLDREPVEVHTSLSLPPLCPTSVEVQAIIDAPQVVNTVTRADADRLEAEAARFRRGTPKRSA